MLSPYSALSLVRQRIHVLRVVSAIRAWLWYEYGFCEWEVQLDVPVHCSSCGTHRDVVHGPLKGSIIVAAMVFASRCRVVVGVSLLMVLSILFGTAWADDWKYTIYYFQYQVDVGVLHAEWPFSSNDDICPSTFFPGSS